ncbi:MAG: site-2 protease family protein [Candidatus Peribacteria bacterium]|jgi:Zn-dependent protease|nr:site-2 protease family protein [Candidatus Peribacteria bacterium]
MRDELISSLAGPAMNLALALVGLFIMMLYASMMGISVNALMNYQFDMVTLFWWMFTTVNISLAVFNLLPIPPLDGYRLIGVFSRKIFLWMRQYSNYIMIALLILIFLPGVNVIGNYIMTVSDVIYRFFFMIISLIFY